MRCTTDRERIKIVRQSELAQPVCAVADRPSLAIVFFRDLIWAEVVADTVPAGQRNQLGFSLGSAICYDPIDAYDWFEASEN